MGGPKKKWTDSRRREPLSAAMQQRKKNHTLSLLLVVFPDDTPLARSERDINLGRFARIECFSSRISSRFPRRKEEERG